MSSNEEKVNTAEEQNPGNEEAELNEQEAASAEESNNDLDELLLQQQNRIEELEEEVRKSKETHLRKAAEMENFKKRLQRERDQIIERAREAAVDAFLPVNDDLLRTLEALEKTDADPSYLDGIKMVASKFEDVLKRYGVERIDQTGVPFDVDLHDAMMRQKPEDDSIESGTVLQVLENGYRIGDKTLRHAKVIVSE
jgi:molecular chaperone GrpE